MWKLTMKSVVSSDGEKTFLYPIKVYYYTPVKQSIQKLLQQVDADGEYMMVKFINNLKIILEDYVLLINET